MNQFLLPESSHGAAGQVLHGAQAMELLINGLLKLGARKERMRAKLFGGARMMAGLSDVGAANAAFAEAFLRDEGIACLGSSLGGYQARRVRFWPATGRAAQRQFARVEAVKPEEVVEAKADVTLF